MSMANTLEKAAKKLMRLTAPQPHIPLAPLTGLVRVGTPYGGSVIPEGLLTADSVCILAGAGEDISFDVGIVQRYGCHVHIFDPTPRAVAHFEQLVYRVNNGERMPINHSKWAHYVLDKERLPRLRFEAVGIWTCSATCRFFAPPNEGHVSHSVVNIHKTDHSFEAQTERLSAILLRHGIHRLDLLKLDIAGAEYGVLETVIQDKLDIRAICVEFTEGNTPIDECSVSRIEQAVEQLRTYGYVAVSVDANCNVTLLRGDVYRELSSDAAGCSPQRRSGGALMRSALEQG